MTAAPRSRYRHDDEVLPKALFEVCRTRLGKATKVSFQAGGPLCATEKLLGESLSLACRAALRTVVVGAVQVYFRKPREEDPRFEDARWLLAHGHTLQAVADAIGVARSTLTKHASGTRPRGAPGHALLSGSAPEKAHEIGREALVALARSLGASLPDETSVSLEAALGETPEGLRRRAILAGRAVVQLRSRKKS
jgi:hypothetical protein